MICILSLALLSKGEGSMWKNSLSLELYVHDLREVCWRLLVLIHSFALIVFHIQMLSSIPKGEIVGYCCC